MAVLCRFILTHVLITTMRLLVYLLRLVFTIGLHDTFN